LLDAETLATDLEQYAKLTPMHRWTHHLLAFAIAVAGAAAGCACGSPPGKPAAAPAGNGSQQTKAPGEYLVTLAAPAEVEAIVGVYGRFGIRSIRHLGSNVFLVTLAEDPGPATMEELRAESAQIKAVEPNFRYRSQ
jgi:hypothetical protein